MLGESFTVLGSASSGTGTAPEPEAIPLPFGTGAVGLCGKLLILPLISGALISAASKWDTQSFRRQEIRQV
jgi:hypothetical protein